MTNTNIQIPMTGYLRLQKGGKRIAARRTFHDNEEVFEVSYFDTEYDKLTHTKGECCRRPTIAKTEAWAIRKINDFFNE